MNNKLRAGIMGGLVMGVLCRDGRAVSRFPQVASVASGPCWAARSPAYLYIKKSPTPARIGEGVAVGAIAGAVGAVISLVPFLLVSLYSPTGRRPKSRSYARGSASLTLRSSGCSPPWPSSSQVILALVGGIVGVALFEQRKSAPRLRSRPFAPPATARYYGGHRRGGSLATLAIRLTSSPDVMGGCFGAESVQTLWIT